ncbi:MAG: response regulator [Candidatus Rokuibacteriota bacterium]
MTTGTANRSLMVIDDDPDIRGMLQHLFRERGYDVTTASDGEEGLRLSHERRPDLIILDILMPRMSGLEVLASLKRSQPDVPVIVVSAGGADALDQASLAMFSRIRTGVGRLFHKPLDLNELAAAVDELLARADGCAQAAG